MSGHKKQMSRLGLAIAVAAVPLATVAAPQAARAADYTWTKSTGSNLHWNTATQDNWGTGVAGAFPSQPGDKAIITTDISADMLILLNQGITIGALDIGDASSTNNSHEFQINTGSGSNVLTFESATPGGATTLNVIAGAGANTPTHVTNVLVEVGGTSTLTVNSLGIQNFAFGGGLDLNARQVIFAGEGAGTINVSGDLLGTGTLVKNNASAMGFNSAKSFQGTLQINRSSLTMVTGSAASAAHLEINGAMTLNTGTTQQGGSVVIGSTGSTTTNNPGQRLPSARVTMNSGSLTHNGQYATGTTWAGQSVQDNVTTFNFNSGFSFISMGRGASTTETVLNITTLQRGAGATVYLRGLNNGSALGTETKVKAGNATDFFVGDAAGDSPTELRIIPWIATRLTNSGTANPEGFTTYASDTGLRTLSATEYNSSITAGSTHNVKVASADLTGLDRAVNSLTATWFNGSNFGIGRTLTVTSGGVFFGQGNTQIGTAGSSASGTLAFGSVEGMFWQSGSGANQVHAAITGTKGFTKADTGLLTLTGDNSGLSGAVHVSGGQLRVGNGTQVSNLGNSWVTVHTGAILQLSNSNALANTADVYLQSVGLFNGKLVIDAEVDDTISALFLNGVAVPVGIYHSGNSGFMSSYVTFGNANASLEVTAVPEPAALSLLVVGAVGLPRRRRR